MIHLLKAELQKILTTRATYGLLAFCFVLTAFIAGYVMGYRGSANASNTMMLAGSAVIIATNLIFFLGLPGVLLVTNDYRYNTILYTLTASNSRLKVWLAKVIVASVFTLLATLLFAALALLFTYIGVQIKGADLTGQVIPYADALWRLAFYGWGYAMFAVIFAFIVRNQIATIVALLVLPGTVEGLLGLLLKQNNFYLPFSALNSVLQQSPFSHTKAALIVAGYVVAGLVISALLFKRRDAN